MGALKVRHVDPDKYNEKSKQQLVTELVMRDNKAANGQVEMTLQEHRAIRMGSTSGVALLMGLLYAVKPTLENIMGTPVSLDHLAALGGAAGAFLSEDQMVAQASEGVANAGLVPILRKLGGVIGGFTVK